MKLRQKLAMVLASSMIMAAVPVVTMADTKTTANESYYVAGYTYGYGYTTNSTDLNSDAVILSMSNDQDLWYGSTNLDVDGFVNEASQLVEFTIFAEDKSVEFSSSLYRSVDENAVPAFYADGVPVYKDETDRLNERYFTLQNGVYTGFIAESDKDYVKDYFNINGAIQEGTYTFNTISEVGLKVETITDASGTTVYSRSAVDVDAIIKAIESIVVDVDTKDITTSGAIVTDVATLLANADFGDELLAELEAVVVEELNLAIEGVEGVTTEAALRINNNGDFTIVLSDGTTVKASAYAVGYDAVEIKQDLMLFKEFTVEHETSERLLVTLNQKFSDGQSLRLPIAFKALSGSPILYVKGAYGITSQYVTLSGLDIFNYETSIELGKKGELSVDAGGALGTIEFHESVSGAFRGIYNNPVASGEAGVNYLIQLKDSKLEWNLSTGQDLSEYVNLRGGLRGNDVTVTAIAVDSEEMIINIRDNNDQGTLPGYVELSNLPVKLEDRRTYLELGELEVAITEVELIDTDAPTAETTHAIEDFENAHRASARFVLADIIQEQVLINVLETVDLIAGQDAKTAMFELKQVVEGALNTADPFYMSLSNGRFAYDTKYGVSGGEAADIVIEFDGKKITNGEVYNALGKWVFAPQGNYSNELELYVDVLIDYLVETGYIKDAGDKEEVHEVLNGVEFGLKIYSRIGTVNDIEVAGQSKDMILTVDSRNFDEDLELFVGTVTRGFEVEFVQDRLELGVKEQFASQLVITETDEETFRDGRTIFISIEDASVIGIKGVTISAEGMDIEVRKSGGGTTSVSNGSTATIQTENDWIEVTIVNESVNTPGVISIDAIEYNVPSNVPRGDYDLYIYGSAIDFQDKGVEGNAWNSNRHVEVEHFVKVGNDVFVDQITSEIDFKNATATITTEHGTRDAELMAVPFLSEAGRAMVGVRDLATFFNIIEENIMFTAGGHVTIWNGADVITLSNGSQVIYKNGQPIYMDEAMRIVDDRAFAPVSYIARALNLSIQYDDVNKVATFTNTPVSR
ncbi:MAG: hypothetical protein ATN35_04115 [Epulopiscium sp. Nele67-Bin004]|nr:MAG: hypothetical protein ATN35_04115 [Epulopiscium sp. Nele67-Bin004]